MEEKKVNKGLMKQTDSMVTSLEKLFKSLPHLPENIREILVQIAPWLALIFGVLGILTGIGAMGLSPIAMFGGVRSGTMVFLTGAITLVSSVLMLLAFPKLNRRSYQGWVYLFWAEVLNAVYAVLMVSVGSALGVLVGLYLLFEIKRYFK